MAKKEQFIATIIDVDGVVKEKKFKAENALDALQYLRLTYPSCKIKRVRYINKQEEIDNIIYMDGRVDASVDPANINHTTNERRKYEKVRRNTNK